MRMDDPTPWQQLVQQWAIWVTAVLTALGVLWKAMKTVWSMARNVDDLVDVVREQLVTGNGGSTLKDQLSEMADWRARDMVMREERQASHDLWRSEVGTRFDRLEDRQAQILERLLLVEEKQEEFDPPGGTPV